MAYLDAAALTNIRAALFDRDETAREQAMIALLDAEQSVADGDLIAAARAEHGGDDVQIDDDAGTSDTDEGRWVQAWVFMPDPDAAGDDDDD
jgi:hypothetical protein